jgi:hypothetical protein
MRFVGYPPAAALPPGGCTIPRDVQQTQRRIHGSFLKAYSASAETAFDNNNVAAAVLALMQEEGAWRGTAADLILTPRKRFPALTEPAEAFPRQPSTFGSELRCITPSLRRQVNTPVEYYTT